MSDYFISVNFDESRLPVGKVELNEAGRNIHNLHEYYIAPMYKVKSDTKEIEVLAYSFIHRSNMPTAEAMKKRETEMGL